MAKTGGRTENPKETKAEEIPDVIIYTDGACAGNPGPGGYGVVLIAGEKRKELYGGYRLTTNNRMEMTAAIVALKALKRSCKALLHSDSKYLIDSITKGWVYNWQRKNWMRTNTEKALNVDLWKELLPLLKQHKVTFKWVKGHANITENEVADRLSVKGAEEAKINGQVDVVYEKENNINK